MNFELWIGLGLAAIAIAVAANKYSSFQKNATDNFTLPEPIEKLSATRCEVNLPSPQIISKIIGRNGKNLAAIESSTKAELTLNESSATITIQAESPSQLIHAQLLVANLFVETQIYPDRIRELADTIKLQLPSIVKKWIQTDAATLTSIPFSEADLALIQSSLDKSIGRLSGVEFHHRVAKWAISQGASPSTIHFCYVYALTKNALVRANVDMNLFKQAREATWEQAGFKS